MRTSEKEKVPNGEVETAGTVSVDRDDAINAAKTNMNFFGGFCVPDIFEFFFPPIFIAIWELLCEALLKTRGVIRLVIGLPRGFAKTFVLKLLTVWIILFTERNFVLIVCNTEQLAMNFISDVCDILDIVNVKWLFGDWRIGLEKDTQSIKKFGFRGRDIILAGIGQGTSLRGLNLKFRRPDVMICDDMQSREEAEVPSIAEKQLIWFMGTLMKARNYRRCCFIYVGNMYPFKGCILRQLKYNKNWISFIQGGIDSDGNSIWEELRPITELLEELDNDIAMGHPEVFYSEVLNDEEAGSVSGLDVSKIPPYPPHLDGVEPQGGFIIIDPATKKQKVTNNTSVGAFFLFDGVPVFWELLDDVMTPQKTIQETLKMALRLGIRVIAVESNAYQYTLITWFEWFCQQLNITGIEFVELYAGNMTKNAKIKAMLPGLVKAEKFPRPEIYLHPRVRSIVINQITQWNPLKQHNIDDVLDLLAWVDKCIQLYGNLMELSGGVMLTVDISPSAATDEEMAPSF